MHFVENRFHAVILNVLIYISNQNQLFQHNSTKRMLSVAAINFTTWNSITCYCKYIDLNFGIHLRCILTEFALEITSPHCKLKFAAVCRINWPSDLDVNLRLEIGSNNIKYSVKKMWSNPVGWICFQSVDLCSNADWYNLRLKIITIFMNASTALNLVNGK